jgi:hypothetical protein
MDALCWAEAGIRAAPAQTRPAVTHIDTDLDIAALPSDSEA